MKCDLNRISLLLRTIYYLKMKQIYYRLYYITRTKWRKLYHFKYPLTLKSQVNIINLSPSIPSSLIYQYNRFTFLNIEHHFDKKIDWNYSGYGKLWTYNLTYFDYLNQNAFSKQDGIRLINDFIDQSDAIKDGYMPFPISLRGINWIKFLSQHKIKDQKINDSLYAQYMILIDNIEYHILGNHLLENAFSLLFGAYYFQDEKLYLKVKEIFSAELKEQILEDGAHFELSPMYHQIMLFRVLDCVNLIQNNNWKNDELLDLLISKAEIMLGWLNTMTYENGDIPLLNDSTNNIAPTTRELNAYATALNVKTEKIELSKSGYRKIKNGRYEMIIDVGNIGPDYIPGHAHSDTFNFELYMDGKPFIVDTGLSTYETDMRRTLERSTLSHNTIEVDSMNQSEVWDGFRVGRRAKIIHLEEKENYIEATHDGYRHIGVLHTRKFTSHERAIIIEDSIESSGVHTNTAYLHFYPGLSPKVKGNNIILLGITITIYNANSLDIEEYGYSGEFNRIIKAFTAKIVFSDHLKMEMQL
ncbi:hypothetical protein TSL6_09740 [Sulfurovum sp. TSL6]|uniref:alginate lyase family protein n=1 Tax=Sulfurovum sp. TSL6 TaxID=2826995 RepID=UPI001CC7674D|nr:alginate lyase family protein [Sulfurovum sp. TSL6]GIU00468.1 hypothetical protein TSL6_09740 [Sulfurovum sp. TSL6]